MLFEMISQVLIAQNSYRYVGEYQIHFCENKTTIWSQVIIKSFLDECRKVATEMQLSVVHLTASTGQGASRMTCCAVEPNTNFPTFDFFLTPIMISSISLFFANSTRSSPGD